MNDVTVRYPNDREPVIWHPMKDQSCCLSEDAVAEFLQKSQPKRGKMKFDAFPFNPRNQNAHQAAMRKAILELLAKSEEPLQGSQIKAQTGCKMDEIYHILCKDIQNGFVRVDSAPSLKSRKSVNTYQLVKSHD